MTGIAKLREQLKAVCAQIGLPFTDAKRLALEGYGGFWIARERPEATEGAAYRKWQYTLWFSKGGAQVAVARDLYYGEMKAALTAILSLAKVARLVKAMEE